MEDIFEDDEAADDTLVTQGVASTVAQGSRPRRETSRFAKYLARELENAGEGGDDDADDDFSEVDEDDRAGWRRSRYSRSRGGGSQGQARQRSAEPMPMEALPTQGVDVPPTLDFPLSEGSPAV